MNWWGAGSFFAQSPSRCFCIECEIVQSQMTVFGSPHIYVAGTAAIDLENERDASGTQSHRTLDSAVH